MQKKHFQLVFVLALSLCSLLVYPQMSAEYLSDSNTSDSNLSQGLVARFLMNADARDAADNKNHGYVNGYVKPTEDRFGNECGAMYFDGETGFISVPDSKSLSSPEDEISIAAWVKINDGAAFADLKWMTICCKSDLPEETDNNPHYRLQSTIVTVSVNTDFTEELKQPFEFDTWYFYASTYDGHSIKAYLNGIKVMDMPYYTEFEPNNSPLEIGRDVPGVMEYFHGSMDDLRIYNRALSNKEIQSLFWDQSDRDTPKPCVTKIPKKKGKTPNPEIKPEPIPQKKTKKRRRVTVPPTTTTPPNPIPTPPIPTKPRVIPTVPTRTIPVPPTTFENIPIDYGRTITVRSNKLKFLIYDHEEEDGDIVSINFNGQWIADKYAIQHKHKTKEVFEVEVIPKAENYLFSKAWNLGGIPPNTLTLEIEDGVGKTRVLTINSDLTKSGGVKIVFNPD
ncbi:MAG: LamG domain-containing protein [Chitinophagales bacterium]